MEFFNKIKKHFYKKKKPVSRIILNIISILMMCTGPFLMILPGPQIISWLGLAIFIYTNYDLLIKYKWFKWIILLFKYWNISRKLKNRKMLRIV